MRWRPPSCALASGTADMDVANVIDFRAKQADLAAKLPGSVTVCFYSAYFIRDGSRVASSGVGVLALDGDAEAIIDEVRRAGGIWIDDGFLIPWPCAAVEIRDAKQQTRPSPPDQTGRAFSGL